MPAFGEHFGQDYVVCDAQHKKTTVVYVTCLIVSEISTRCQPISRAGADTRVCQALLNIADRLNILKSSALMSNLG